MASMAQTCDAKVLSEKPYGKKCLLDDQMQFEESQSLSCSSHNF